MRVRRISSRGDYRIEKGGGSVGALTFVLCGEEEGDDLSSDESRVYLSRSRPCGEVRSSAGPTGTIRVGLMSPCVI